MHLDVLDLRNFYYRSALGRAAQTVIREDLRALWPDMTGRTVVGFGFAVPLLRPFLEEARRVIALMPGPQGVMPWPRGAENISALCEDTLWPLQAGQVDRLVLMHGLETSDHADALLEECWRVLAPDGRIVIIVPNRAGLWSRSDTTPFGYGRPYSASQLEAQLRRHRFGTEDVRSTLYQPPSHQPGWRRMARLIERAGRNLPFFAAGGVLMAEAAKQSVALGGTPAPVTRRARPVRVGGATPAPVRRVG